MTLSNIRVLEGEIVNVGPIDLNLLGLDLFVDEITIDLDAQPGPGNLLGNLLCAGTPSP